MQCVVPLNKYIILWSSDPVRDLCDPLPPLLLNPLSEADGDMRSDVDWRKPERAAGHPG